MPASRERPLRLFYCDRVDRWLPIQAYPHRCVRRLCRAGRWIRGHETVFRNLCAGLQRLGIQVSINDWHGAKDGDIACVIGKRHVIAQLGPRVPMVIGPGCFNHPLDAPRLLERFDIRRILVPCEWMRQMCAPEWGDLVAVWPVGIDVDWWSPGTPDVAPAYDLLVYEKLFYTPSADRERIRKLVDATAAKRNLRARWIRYGRYRRRGYRRLLRRSRALLLLTEHETQGLATLEAMATGVPVLALDQQGLFRDPEFWPHVRFGPVTCVPYWDRRCGVRFHTIRALDTALDEFEERSSSGDLQPRAYVFENLRLERCAAEYLSLTRAVV